MSFRRLAALSLTLFLFPSTPSYLLAAEPSDPTPLSPPENLFELYFSGRPYFALQQWQQEFQEAIKRRDTREIFLFARNLSEFCKTANDDDCILNVQLGLAGHLQEFGTVPDADRELFGLLVGYTFGIAALASHDSNLTERALQTGLIGDNENLFLSPIFYIKRTFIAAEMLLRLKRLPEASLALDKGLTVLASLKSIRSIPADYAVLISQAIALLTAMDRTTDALALATASAGFIEVALRHTSIEYARFQYVTSVLAFETGRFQLAKQRAESALTRFDALDLPSYNFAGERMDLFLIIAAVCALGEPDPECIERKLKSAYKEMQHFDASEPGEPPTFIEAYLAHYDVLIRILSSQKHATWDSWYPTVHRILEANWEFDQAQEAHGAKLIALGLLKEFEGEPGYDQLVRDGLKALLSDNRWTQSERIGSLLLPKFTTRLLAARGAALLAVDRSPNEEEADLILQAIELYSRGPHFKDSDALADLAAALTPTDRATRHALLRTRSRELDHRYHLIVEKIQRLSSEGMSNSEPVEVDFNVHRGLVEIAKQRLLLEETVALTRKGPSVNYFPGAAAVQSALLDDEVFLYFADSVGSYVLSVCITRDRASAIGYEIDKKQFSMDLRILRAAMTLEHAPSKELDSQYPVSAARRLHDVILGVRMAEPGRCIKPGDTVYFAQADTLQGVPLGAMLRDEPQRDSIGWVLGSAPWAFTQNHFVYLRSSRAFVAQRSLQSDKAALSENIITVGDPQLGGMTIEGEERLAALIRRSGLTNGAQTLSALRSLPNTADEARHVFRSLGANGSILIGEDATEGNFRSKFLGRYRYIHLATHGLIREELPGLTEAALVFTPGSSSDPADDGILTASEIADLSLNADVAVLSACNTAMFAQNYFLSETQGLTTAFAIAGVRSTVVTLWPVETVSSERLVTTFFDVLSGNAETSARALTNAKHRFLGTSERAYHHPRFWASFVAFGNSFPEQENGNREATKVQIFDRPGDAGSIVPLPSSSHAAVFWGPYVDDGPVASISRLDENLEPIWRHDQTPFGRNRLLRQSNGILLGLGYEFRDLRPTPGIFSVNEATGEQSSYRLLQHRGMPGHIVGSYALSSDQLLVMTGHAEDPYGKDSTESIVTYTLHTLGADLNVLAKIVLPYRLRGGIPRNSGIVSSGTHWLAFVTEPEPYLADPTQIGLFGTLEACAPKRDTHLIWLRAKGEIVEAEAVLKGISLRSVIVTEDGSFLFLGSERMRCTFDERLVIGRLDPGTDAWEPIYTDGSPFPNLASEFAEDTFGNLVVAGSVTRNLDGNFSDPADQTSFLLGDGLLRSRARAPTEGRVLWISKDGVLLDEKVFSAGVDVYINGMSVTTTDILLAGSIGSFPFVMSVPTRKLVH